MQTERPPSLKRSSAKCELGNQFSLDFSRAHRGREETRTFSAQSLCQVSESLAPPQRGRTLLEAAASPKEALCSSSAGVDTRQKRNALQPLPTVARSMPALLMRGPPPLCLSEHKIHKPWVSFSAILQSEEDSSLQALIGHKIAAGRVQPRAEEQLLVGVVDQGVGRERERKGSGEGRKGNSFVA